MADLVRLEECELVVHVVGEAVPDEALTDGVRGHPVGHVTGDDLDSSRIQTDEFVVGSDPVRVPEQADVGFHPGQQIPGRGRWPRLLEDRQVRGAEHVTGSAGRVPLEREPGLGEHEHPSVNARCNDRILCTLESSEFLQVAGGCDVLDTVEPEPGEQVLIVRHRQTAFFSGPRDESSEHLPITNH